MNEDRFSRKREEVFQERWALAKATEKLSGVGDKV
jgi:hypothetical protein